MTGTRRWAAACAHGCRGAQRQVQHALDAQERRPVKRRAPGQSVVSGVAGGKTYDLTFWAKQTDHGVSYVQEYAIEWYDDNGALLPGKGLT